MIGAPLRQSTRCLNIAPTERLFMSENEFEFLNPTEDEAHITRRLGRSVASVWPKLPPDVQEIIVQRAIMVFDEDETVQLHEQIRDYLGKYAGKV